MLKFFRKYNKILLAVFMVLLMVVFIGGSALTALLTPRTNLVVAETNLGVIKSRDQQRARNTTNILGVLGIPWQRPLGGTGEPIELVDWILLTREAAQFETQIGPEAVEANLGVGRDQLDLLARRLGVKTDRVLVAMSEFISVQIAARAIVGTTVPSSAEVRATARDVLDKVRVNAVLLPAEAFIDDTDEFTDEETETQLTAYRDAEPGSGLSFGYYVPPKLSAQYIKIDPDVIAEHIGIPNLEKKAKRYFEENREKNPAFKRPVERPEEAEGPVQEQSPYLEWEEAKDEAIATVRRQEAEEAAANIANWVLQYDAERWFDAERGTDGYKTTPESVATPDHYHDLLERIPATIAFPNAVSVVQTDFFAKEEAVAVADIGKAVYRPQTTAWQPFGKLAFLTKPIVPEVPRGEGTTFSDYLALFQTCPYALTDSESNRYVFRIIDSKPGHPAESVDEVRDRIVTDLRLLRGWEVAMARAEGLRSCSPDITLQEAFESDEGLIALQEMGERVGFFESPPVARFRSAAQAATGRNQPTAYIDFNMGSVPNEVIDRWFELEDAWERTAVYELKDRATIMVMEWVETQRGRYDEFDEKREEIARQLTENRRREAIASWFDKEQIRARNGFQLAQ